MSGRARTAAVVVLAVLAVLALSFAAATLDSTVAPERGGGVGAGAGNGATGGNPPSAPIAPPPGETLQIPFPPGLLAALAAVVVLAALAYTYHNRRETFAVLVAGLVVLGLLAGLFSLISAPGSQVESAASGNTSGGGFQPGDGGGSAGAAPSPVSLPLLLALLVALVAAGVAVVRRRGGDARRAAEAEDDADDETDAAAVGRAAGRAADRIEGEEEIENEVYRAWREMTALLDVANPETSTPGEFADAAVAAGLDREDVTELTRLFEDVRYGDRAPGADSERRAVAVFRRIERGYAEDEP